MLEIDATTYGYFYAIMWRTDSGSGWDVCSPIVMEFIGVAGGVHGLSLSHTCDMIPRRDGTENVGGACLELVHGKQMKRVSRLLQWGSSSCT